MIIKKQVLCLKIYESILELYGANILGKYSNTLYFKIKDRGDGLSIYGAIAGYTGSYKIRFLVIKK